MPCGCEGCPLFDEDSLDDDGNMVCDLKSYEAKMNRIFIGGRYEILQRL